MSRATALQKLRRTLRPFFGALRTATRVLRGKHHRNHLMERRVQLGRLLAVEFGNTVRYGLFKGLRLPDKTRWGKGGDVGSMLLGLYEQELLEAFRVLPRSHNVLIDLGAANGYYGLGVLVNGRFEFSYCFERSEPAREIIATTAELNGLTGRVQILGNAAQGFWHSVRQPLSQCVLLVDIEGGEFDLLDDELLAAFSGAILFVELHDWFYPDGDEKLKRLRERASRHFRISELTTAARDLSQFPELSRLSDDDRWILCSEGRGQRMTWWRLDPIGAP